MDDKNAAPMVAMDIETHDFSIPKKEVTTATDIAKWEGSEAYRDILGFIDAMNESIKGKKLTDTYTVSPVVKNIVDILNVMDKWIDEIPPEDQPQRFGNKSYRKWFEKFKEEADGLLKNALMSKFEKAVPEICVYFVESVGNSTRIDYGTGHELAFIAFLCCLYKIGALTQEDAVAVVFSVFNIYLILMRKLQTVYKLEPAGSQGVWNLDDYQFIPFIWGSAQLIDHKRLKPKSFPDAEICMSYGKDYMFLACIHYIHQVKTGPFAEHSNQLWNISGVPLWSKVNTGLVKMYKAEVLNKFPVIQHFLFGSLLTIKQV